MADAYSNEFPSRPVVADPEAPEKVQRFISQHQYLFLLVAVLVAQLLLLSFQITRGQGPLLIQVWVVSLLEPFQRATHATVKGVSGTWNYYLQLRDAARRNRELEQELGSARAALQRLMGHVDELASVRAQLDFKNQIEFETVAAEVIASSPGLSTRAVFLNKGSNEGLAPDMAVYTPEGVVGKVLHAYPRSSQVLVLTDRHSGVGALIEVSRVQGVLKGYGRALCRMEYVMNEQEIRVGDRVVTSGQDRIYPKGLLVGTVVEAKEGHIYKEIWVKPAARLERLELVLVILPPNSEVLDSVEFRPPVR